MEADQGAQPGIRQRALRHLHIGNLDVVRHLLAAEPYRMDWNPLAANLGDRFEIDTAGIIGSIAQQDNSPDGEARCVLKDLFETFADVRRLARGVELLEFRDSLQLIAEPIQANLKPLLQLAH